MSDLSRLNPTPHAIAVYASRPLSPGATQHSLPSGRCPLLGPVFHRLDRTSFAWRTHSITSSARSRNDSGIVIPSAFAVDRLMTRSNLVVARPECPRVSPHAESYRHSHRRGGTGRDSLLHSEPNLPLRRALGWHASSAVARRVRAC